MNTKKCVRCKIEKTFDQFNKHRICKFGVDNICKKCNNIICKQYRNTHKKILLKKSKIKWQKNKIRYNKQRKKYRKIHKNLIKEQKHKFYIKNKIKINKKFKKYYKINKRKIIIQAKLYLRKRRKVDKKFRILECLRSRLTQALKDKHKPIRTIELLGCSIEFLKEYLTKQFKKGMNWDNYGNGWNGRGMKQWHIDHIRPCASFDLSKPKEQRKCFHYTNLQPLWAKENWSKKDKIRRNK